MTELQDVNQHELKEWLAHVNRPRTVKLLMLAIAHLEGVDTDELKQWYDVSDEEVDHWFGELERDPLPVVIARHEGVDFAELASTSGLTTRTIEDWFASLEREPIDHAADIISRYSARQTRPLLSTTESRVHYLDFGAIQSNGWSIDDEDLFEKASDAGLDPELYGRVLIEPGQTILEAVEQRGMSWPYACRGGACANCAVIVLEGDIAMPGQTVLSDHQVRTVNARLTCVGVPVTDTVKLIKNVQRLDDFEELRLPSPMADLSG